MLVRANYKLNKATLFMMDYHEFLRNRFKLTAEQKREKAKEQADKKKKNSA